MDLSDFRSQVTSLGSGEEQLPTRRDASGRSEDKILPKVVTTLTRSSVDKGRILIVDDDEAGRYTLGVCLRRAGYEVMEAKTGGECLRIAASEEVDLVVLDIKLPDASGIEICKQLKRGADTNTIPVIQISAFLRDASDRIEGLESGADAYLTTPFEPRELLAHVSGLMRVRRTEKELRLSEQKYCGLFNSLDEGFFLIDVIYDRRNRPIDLEYIEANAAATRILGNDYTGRRLKEINPDYEPYWFEIFGQVAISGQSVRMERYAAPDNRWYSFYVFKVGDATSRRVGNIFQDITDRKHREAHAAFLVEVSDKLAGLRSADEVMQQIGAMIRAYLKVEGCTVCEVRDKGKQLNVLSGWQEVSAPDWLHNYCLSDLFGQGFLEASARGETIAVSNTETDPRTATGNYDKMGVYSFLSAPFHSGQEWKNSLVLTGPRPREWGEHEIDLVHELANRIFVRLERARTEVELEAAARFADENPEGVMRLKGGCVLDYTNASARTLLRHLNGGEGIPEQLSSPAVAALREGRRRELQIACGQTLYLVDFAPVPSGGYVNLYARDVTRRNEAERALRESEELLSSIYSGVEAAITVAEPMADGKGFRFLSVNRAAVEWTGISLERWIGSPPEELLSAEDAAAVSARYREALQIGRSINYEEHLCFPSKSCWALTTVSPLRDADGRVRRVVATSVDITDQKRAEAALRESELFYRQTLESIPGMVFTTRPDGNCDYRSQQWVDYTGVPMSEHVGRGWNRLLHSEDQPQAMASWNAAVESGTPYDLAYRVRRHDGHYEWFKVIARPIKNQAGNIVRWFGVAANIDELKRTEEAFKRSSKRLELLSRTVSSLLTASNPQNVVKQLCNDVRTFLDCDVFFNFLLDSPRQGLRLNACGGVAPRLAREVEDLELNASLCGSAAQSACRVHAENIGATADPRAALVRSLGVRAYACHPLLTHNGEVFGTLSFGTRNRDRFSDDDLELMKTVTDHVAVAMLRRKTEEALREAVEQYEGQVRLFEGVASTTPDFVYIFDLHGRFLYANRQLLKVWGMSLEQAVGRTCRELGYEQWHHDMHMREINQVIETRQPVKGEIPFRAPLTGIFGIYEYIFTPVIGRNGKVEVIAGTTRDVTERKRTEEALRESEERLRQAADLVGLCPYTWNIQTGELAWDPRIKPMWGLPTDAIIDMHSWKAGVHPDDLRMVEDRVARSLDPRGDGLYEAEYRVNGADGVQRWISTRGRTTFAAEKPVIHLGVVVEITAKKQIEEALRESEERFRTLADSTSVLIWVHNSDGGLLFVNRAWIEFFGVTLDQVTGGKWRPLVYPDDTAGYVGEFLRCHAERREFSAQARVKRHDGRWRWVESFATPRFSATGEYLGMAGSSVDITARKEAEAVLARDKEDLERLVAERTSRLQELVGELEHFSYTITHDMRAPLRAMRGLAEIMSEEEAEWSDEERRKFTRRIITAAERMDGLITDALQYSKMVRQELPLAPVDVGRLLRGMLDTYPEFQSLHADISVAENLPVVMGNEAGLTQCFSNLLGNATRFVRPGQRPEVRVWAEDRDSWVRLWVKDNGIGISPSMLARVFEMFSRGTSPEAGTGIGLALVRKVVDRMGGRVGVESEPGQGSRFWVELKPGASGIAAPAAPDVR